MRQILQNLKTGKIEIADLPCPQVKPGHLLIRTRRSLISVGTERMLVDFARANLLNKVRQQPDKVKMVLDKICTDGLLPTLEAVHTRLDKALPMGYCNFGRVLEVGEGVQGFAVGDSSKCLTAVMPRWSVFPKICALRSATLSAMMRRHLPCWERSLCREFG